MSVATAKWTVEEYHHLVTSGALAHKSVELLQGEIVQMSPEGPLHSNRIRQSAKVARQQVGSDLEVSETHPITLSDSEPEPDLAIILSGSYDKRHPDATETKLVIEFADSSLEKDLEEKRLTYAQAVIEECWVVNLRDRQVVVFRNPTEGDYRSQQIITTGMVSSLVCPEVAIATEVLLGIPESGGQ